MLSRIIADFEAADAANITGYTPGGSETAGTWATVGTPTGQVEVVSGFAQLNNSSGNADVAFSVKPTTSYYELNYAITTTSDNPAQFRFLFCIDDAGTTRYIIAYIKSVGEFRVFAEAPGLDGAGYRQLSGVGGGGGTYASAPTGSQTLTVRMYPTHFKCYLGGAFMFDIDTPNDGVRFSRLGRAGFGWQGSGGAEGDEMVGAMTLDHFSTVANANADFHPIAWETNAETLRTNNPGNNGYLRTNSPNLRVLIGTERLGANFRPMLSWGYGAQAPDTNRQILGYSAVAYDLYTGQSATARNTELWYIGYKVDTDLTGLWASGYGVQIDGFVIDEGSTFSAPTNVPASSILFRGDSYTNGVGCNYERVGGASVLRSGWAGSPAPEFDAYNACCKAVCDHLTARRVSLGYSSYGYTITTGGGDGSVPKYTLSWNLYRQGVSRLSAGLYLSPTDYEFIFLGTNDATFAATDADVRAAVQTCGENERSANPASVLFFVIPPNTSKQTAITNGYADFLANNPGETDAVTCFLLDTDFNWVTQSGTENSPDALHLNKDRAAEYGAGVMAEFDAQTNGPATAPTIAPNGGTVFAGQRVTLSSPTTGATIYYTTDGTDPTNASTLYDSGNKPQLNTVGAVDFRAITYATDYLPSTVTQATFDVVERNALPVSGLSLKNSLSLRVARM